MGFSAVANSYKEHFQDILSFLKKSQSAAFFAERNKFLPNTSIDNIVFIYFAAKRNFSESSKIKSILSIYENKNVTPLHKAFFSIVEKKCSLDEKILARNSNFLGSFAMAFIGAATLPIALICSFSWVAIAAAVSLLVGSLMGIFNYYHYKEEDGKLLTELKLILVQLKDLRQSSYLPAP